MLEQVINYVVVVEQRSQDCVLVSGRPPAAAPVCSNLADERCSPAVLDFLRSTYVGRASGGELG